jgi:DNA invertase Pin-like site-specific DNA recombinase
MKEYARPVAYIRRSARSRTDPGDISREFQTDTVRERARENGDADRLEVMDADWGRSGAGYGASDKTSERTDFLRLITAVEAGEVTAIYVYDLDRLARSVEWSERLANACERAGTVIYDRRYRYAPADDRDRRDLRREAETNEDYSRKASSKRRATVTLQRERGVRLGQAPYGTRDGEDVAAVVAAFKAAGTYHGAARELTRLGVKSRRGHLPNGRAGTGDGGTADRGSMQGWSASTVKRIVMREAPELVPVDTTGTRGKRATQRWRFSRLLICPHDGSTLTTIPHKGRAPSYACRIGHRSPAGEHPRPWVIAESYVLPWAKDQMARRMSISAEAIDADGVEQSLTELAGKRERVIEMYAEGIIDKAARDKRLAALDGQRNDLDALKRRIVTYQHGIDWDAEPGEVNARLREWWAHVELEYVPADTSAPMIGRNDRSRELDLRPKRAEWRKGPLVIPPPEHEGEEIVHVHHDKDGKDGAA